VADVLVFLYEFNELHSLDFEHDVFVRYEALLSIDTSSPPIIGHLGEQDNIVTLLETQLPFRASHEIKLGCSF
jgi:hypothetical protein